MLLENSLLFSLFTEKKVKRKKPKYNGRLIWSNKIGIWNAKKGKKREEVGGYTMCPRHLENEECPVWCVVQHSKQSTAAPIYIYILNQKI